MDPTVASKGIQEILSKLLDDELFGLVNTVTQGLLRNKLESREGALEVVLTYSRDFLSILRRKVVTREVLFSYLHDKKIPVALPATKSDLIDLIAKYWNIPPVPSLVSENVVVNPQPATKSKDEINTMALKFSEWFYMMMNQDQPIGCEHFWDNSSLKLHLIFGEHVNTEFVENDIQQIVETLFKTKNAHNLYFNPNLMSDGIQGRIDPHGLVVVLACGTLHSNNVCVGIFEQVFMLARDPFADNNWKIKKVELNLRSKNDVNVLPSLCDSSLTANMLVLPTN